MICVSYLKSIFLNLSVIYFKFKEVFLCKKLSQGGIYMAQINVVNLTFSYDTHVDDIFKNASFSIDTNWKIGLIGRNGRGKTTLLNLFMKKFKYSGTISSPVDFEYFPFHIENKDRTSLEVIRNTIAPFTTWEELMNEYVNDEKKLDQYGDILEKYIENDGYIINELIEKEIRKMKLEVEILQRNFSTLSFGEQTKLLLVGLFLRKNHFLLIDEPTNHLDIEGREVISNYLASKSGFILISHDRSFLDKIVDHVLSINKANIEVQRGNFSTWQLNKDRQDEFEKLENEKLKKDIKRLQEAAKQKASWSDKTEASKIGNGPTDRGFIGHKAAKMMKRAKSIEKRQNNAIEEKSKLLKNLENYDDLILKTSEDMEEKILTLNNLSIIYDDKVLFKDVNLKIKPGDRVWLKGSNGSGKSSLIKLILGEDISYDGDIYKCKNISYVSQDTSYLEGNVDELARKYSVDLNHLKSNLYKMGFESIQFEKDVSTWSEGQKKKLLIAKSLCDRASFYIWDEPLNFIDVISRMQIEDLILSVQPTMLFVEHDEFFGERISTKVLELE